MRYLTAIILFAVVASAGVAEATITVDGQMGDWGLSTASYNGSSNLLTPLDSDYLSSGYWSYNNPGGGIQQTILLDSGERVYYFVEDTKYNYVEPEYGGQNYDAEYLGVIVSDDMLYIGIATGQRRDNGFSYFAPGDIQITINDTVKYGIEVGGGAGGSGGTQVSKGDAGSTYSLTSSGYTNGVSNPGTNQSAGDVLQPTNWIVENVGGPPDLETQISSGTWIGEADEYIYNFHSDLGTHAFIELSVPLTMFAELSIPGTPVDMDFAWRPSCGNDDSTLIVENVQWTPPVPEPASIIVWGLLIVSALAAARRCRES